MKYALCVLMLFFGAAHATVTDLAKLFALLERLQVTCFIPSKSTFHYKGGVFTRSNPWDKQAHIDAAALSEAFIDSDWEPDAIPQARYSKEGKLLFADFERWGLRDTFNYVYAPGYTRLPPKAVRISSDWYYHE